MYLGTLICNLREAQEISRQSLAAGLCTESMLLRIENGDRVPDKFLSDRILARLGHVHYGRASFLDNQEFVVWDALKRAIHLLLNQKNAACKREITRLTSLLGRHNRVGRQMALMLRIWLGRRENLSREKMHLLCAEAVALTLPSPALRHAEGYILSAEECSLLLDYLHTLPAKAKDPPVDSRLLEVIRYITSSNYSVTYRAKVYPKAIWYLYRYWESRDLLPENAGTLRRLFDEALDMMRETGGAYYLMEMRDVFHALCACKASPYPKRFRERAEGWFQAYEELLGECGMTAYTTDEYFLLEDTEIYAISEIVPVRRRMLRMTQEELAEAALCGIKTIRRIEQGKSAPQKAVFENVYRALGLYPSYTKADVVTDRADAVILTNEIRRASFLREFEKARELLEKLREMIPMQEIVNRQYMYREMIRNRYLDQKTDRDTYIRQMEALMRLTVPVESIRRDEAIFLSKEEMQCLYYIALSCEEGEEEQKRYMDIMETMFRPYEERDDILSCVDYYILLMGWVASKLGNRKQYDRSDAISRLIIQAGMQKKKINYFYYEVYNLSWNLKEQAVGKQAGKKKGIALKQLKQCLAFADYCKNDKDVLFYENAIKHYPDDQ